MWKTTGQVDMRVLMSDHLVDQVIVGLQNYTKGGVIFAPYYYISRRNRRYDHIADGFVEQFLGRGALVAEDACNYVIFDLK